MKILLIILLIAIFTVGTSIECGAQKKRADHKVPQAVQTAAPIYPIIAIALEVEQELTARILIDRNGEIKSTEFDRGDKVFQIVIRDALMNWRFVRSKRKVRTAKITFVFKLLPTDSKSYVSTIFMAGNRVEVYVRKPKLLDQHDKR